MNGLPLVSPAHVEHHSGDEARKWGSGATWWTEGLLAPQGLSQLLQSLLQLQRELLIALLAHRFHVKLHKLVPGDGQKKQILEMELNSQSKMYIADVSFKIFTIQTIIL